MARRDELDKLRRHHQVLVELSHVATQLLPMDVLLNHVVVQVGKAVEIDHVKVLRYRPDTGDLLAVSGVGWRPGVIGHTTFSADFQSPPGRAFQTGQPVSIPDINQGDQFRCSTTLFEHDIKSLLNVPIQIDGAAWGVLEVDSTELRDFSVDTIDFLMTAASILASALRRDQVEQAHEQAIAQAAMEARRHQVLLEEMQHRVKNNFQTILSMVAIQSARLQTENSRIVLNKIADGIMAMSLAHDQLAPAQGGELVNLPTYLRALTTSIQKPLETIIVEVQADEISVPIEHAVPVGLIVNELLTNSVKHVFGREGGAIRVELQTGPDQGEIRLTVSDNGSGIDPTKPQGSGLKLINALARQLRGKVDHKSSSKGTSVCVVFAPL